jgi:hypothetical protein
MAHAFIDSNLLTYHKEITNYDWKMYMKEKIRFKKIAKMTVTENVILAIFLIMSAILGWP